MGVDRPWHRSKHAMSCHVVRLVPRPTQSDDAALWVVEMTILSRVENIGIASECSPQKKGVPEYLRTETLFCDISVIQEEKIEGHAGHAANLYM